MTNEPISEDSKSPEFNAVWEAVKRWDIEREEGEGYAHATGTDVMIILNALKAFLPGNIININKMTKEWEKEFDKICPAKCEVQIGEESIICDFSKYTPKLKRFISDLLEAQKKETLEKIEEIRKRFRCAACDGAKCEHTLGCQALTELEKFLT